jgi:predicted flap endonuclease-1-like 5' DNA nuclease
VTTPLRSIGAPATRALEAQGVRTLDDVARWTREDLLALHGVGPKAVRLLEQALHAEGLTLAAS